MLLRSFSLVLTACILGGVSGGCKEDPPASLYDPNYVSGLQPTVTSLSPSDSAVAGLALVTITGTNFLPDTARTLVFFDDKRAVVLEASTTQLRVRAVNLVKDPVMVKVAVLGSTLFSDPVRYKLIAPVEDFGFTPNVIEIPTGIECDVDGNVYVSLETSLGNGLGTRKYFRSGKRDTLYISPAPSQVRWASMKFGPGYLYTSATRAIFRIPVGGGSSALWKPIGPAGSTVSEFDFDANRILWASGFDAAVYSVTQAGTVKAFPLPLSPRTSDIRSVRIFNGYLYLAGRVLPDSSVDRVIRRQVFSSDSLGPIQEYFRPSASDSMGIYAITFTDAGEMFVGTDAKNGTIVLVNTNGTYEKFYPGLLKARAARFAFGRDGDLFFSRSGLGNDNRMVRVRTQKLSAPYYGRQ